MRIIFTLGYDPIQTHLRGFIETYIENKGESNGILRTILDRWVSEYQIEESHDEFSTNNEENIIKPHQIPQVQKNKKT
ncbi:unnamed protein product [Rhizophagus irregularis]|nr:unnamed protein product [Rhizophagus irregularis]